MRNLENRLSALEQRQGANGRAFYVWRHEDDAVYQERLEEAKVKCGPFDKIVVIGWQRRQGDKQD